MVYLLGHRNLDEYTYGHKPLDGDLSKIEAINPAPNEGLPFSPNDRIRGYALRPECIPTKIRKRGPKREVPDLEMALGMLCVSSAFKDTVESLEPGAHQFFPVDVVWTDGKLAAKKYLFNVCIRLDSVDRLHTTVPFHYLWQTAGSAGTRLVFSLSAIGHRHIWCDKFILWGPFVSTALANAITTAGLSGVELVEHEEA